MSPDLINGLFEFLGSLFTWLNFTRVIKDRGYAGISVLSLIFFTSWGLWNLYYYPALTQWWSFAGGVSIVMANIFWLVAMLYYGRIDENRL